MLSGILDYIFPKRCINCKALGDYICPNCFIFISFDTKTSCLVCKRQSLNGFTHKICKKKYTIDGCFSAVRYNYIVRKLIYNFKNKPYLLDLQNFLSELFYESLIQNEEFIKLIQKDKWVFVPIALTSKAHRKRGYNQSQILAKKLGQKFKIKTLKPFEEKNNVNFFGLNIFLVDDVINTGTTLKEMAKILKINGANKVFGLILAGK